MTRLTNSPTPNMHMKSKMGQVETGIIYYDKNKR